jgi:hypothetical protein
MPVEIPASLSELNPEDLRSRLEALARENSNLKGRVAMLERENTDLAKKLKGNLAQEDATRVEGLKPDNSPEAVPDSLDRLLNRREFYAEASRISAKVPRPGQTARQESIQHLTFLGINADSFEADGKDDEPARNSTLAAIHHYLIQELKIREGDITCRWSAHEVMVALPRAAAAQIEAKIKESNPEGALKISLNWQGQNILACAGIAEYIPGEDIHDTLDRVEKIVQETKSEGNVQVRIAPRPAED